MPLSPQDEIARYLSAGEHDPLCGAWPGGSVIARAQNGDRALRQALVSKVNDRAPLTKLPDELIDLDVKGFAREKVGPMVRADSNVSRPPIPI
jgi:hypothetical protein